jgi:hypothetical protein
MSRGVDDQRAKSLWLCGEEFENSTGGTPVLQWAWRLQSFDHFPDFILALAKLLLEPTEQFIVLTFSKGQIVIGQTAVALFQLPFDFVPGPFEL